LSEWLLKPDSMRSGYMVPWMRYSAPVRLASASKTRMNSSPMIFRFASGSETPRSFSRKCPWTLVSEGFGGEGCGYAGVYSPAQGDDGLGVADGFPDLLDRLFDGVGGPPVLFAVADVEDEVAEHLSASPGVDDLGVPLEAVEGLGLVSEGGDGGDVCVGLDLELVGEAEHRGPSP